MGVGITYAIGGQRLQILFTKTVGWASYSRPRSVVGRLLLHMVVVCGRRNGVTNRPQDLNCIPALPYRPLPCPAFLK